MVHKYGRDPSELAFALTAAHAAVPLLAAAAHALAIRVLGGPADSLDSVQPQ